MISLEIEFNKALMKLILIIFLVSLNNVFIADKTNTKETKQVLFYTLSSSTPLPLTVS